MATLLLGTLGLGVACGPTGEWEPRAPVAPAKSTDQNVRPLEGPRTLGSEDSSPITDAIQVWRLGADYIPLDDSELPVPWSWETCPFERLDSKIGEFLHYPFLQSAVHHGCAIVVRKHEWRVTHALKSADPLTRLQALVVLMKVRAPRSVDLQWRTLRDLHRELTANSARPLLDELHREFACDSLTSSLEHAVATDDPDEGASLQWALRAAGVTRCWAALDTLRRAATWRSLHLSLAAERSLEDFEGSEANEALLECALTLTSAGQNAARALVRRDPDLLACALLAAEVSRYCELDRAMFIGRAGHSAAVPLLCAVAGDLTFRDVDEACALIERLATPGHLGLVRAFPRHVRPQYADRARRARDAVVIRLNR